MADSKPGILKCIRRALDKKGISYTESQLDIMVGPPFRVSMREILGVTDTAVIEDMIRLYRADYEVEGWRDCSVYPGIEELLARLSENGVRLAVGYPRHAHLGGLAGGHFVNLPRRVLGAGCRRGARCRQGEDYGAQRRCQSY